MALNNNHRAWSTEDENYLTHLWTKTTMPVDEIADELGRTINSVQCRASILNIKKAAASSVWTPEKVQWIRDYVNGHDRLDLNYMSDQLQRSQRAISKQLRIMGVPISIEHDDEPETVTAADQLALVVSEPVDNIEFVEEEFDDRALIMQARDLINKAVKQDKIDVRIDDEGMLKIRGDW